MEVYIDDMLVKSRTVDQHLHNLSLMFDVLKKYNMRLNPNKCAFGVSSGKFLGFMISQQGIEANPEKIKVLLNMQVPKTQMDIQSLTRSLVALAQFISRATDRCTPFFKALKGESLILYLLVSTTAISSVLIRKANIVELPIFYTSHSLQEAELQYPRLEKLRPYFQTHMVTILINQTLRQVLQKSEMSGRLIKWAIELGEFDVHYQPRLAEKG
ncbi:unnamed protein product [Prunus armeniaca]